MENTPANVTDVRVRLTLKRRLGGRHVIGRASEKVHGWCGHCGLDSVYNRRPLRMTLYSFWLVVGMQSARRVAVCFMRVSFSARAGSASSATTCRAAPAFHFDCQILNPGENHFGLCRKLRFVSLFNSTPILADQRQREECPRRRCVFTETGIDSYFDGQRIYRS